MLHTCDQRFDVTGNLENFCELNKALICPYIATEENKSYIYENNNRIDTYYLYFTLLLCKNLKVKIYFIETVTSLV